MGEYLTRLFTDHDVGMTTLAFIVSGFGAYTTSALGRQAATSESPRVQMRWQVLAVAALSFAMWASSFMTMMATRVDARFGFEPGPMIASLFAAFTLVAVGASVTLNGRFTLAPAFGGAIAGLAVSVTHFVAISGYRVAGKIEWSVPAMATSVSVAISLFVFATVIWVRSRSRNPWLPIALFSVGICGSDLLAMNAATISYDPRIALQTSLIDNVSLAWIVGIITVAIATLTWLAQRLNLEHRQRREAGRQQLQQLADVAVEGLIICNGDHIVWINKSLEALLGYGKAAYVNQALTSVLDLAPQAELSRDREMEAWLRVANQQSAVPVRVIMRDIVMMGQPHIVIAVRDQRERLRAEAEMERLANTDPLTGLPNRTRFQKVLERMLTSHQHASTPFALLALDLDAFKEVNDRAGHAAGDAVLNEVAHRLSGLARQGDLVARLGGDEFSILAMIGDGRQSITSLAERVIQAIAEPFVIDGRAHRIGVSVGVAYGGTDGADFETLARSADLALYRAKAEGRSTYRVFEAGMHQQMLERHGMEVDLHHAIERGEFVLHYQPQVHAADGTHAGAEALIRWEHPRRGLVAPNDFIPVLEEMNLIGQVGAWVLRTACKEAARWHESLVVSVNVSPLQFSDPGLSATVESALLRAGLPGHRLELEITESTLIDDLAQVQLTLGSLKRLGVKLSIDDFGTGFSSLGQLRHFSFDRIKIDRSFVRRLPGDDASAAIVRAVVALGHGLGMQTTAEGVETAEQNRFVLQAGCDQIQGFLYGKPVPAALLPDAFSRGTEGPPRPSTERQGPHVARVRLPA